MRQGMNSWTRPNLLTLAVGVGTIVSLVACVALIAPFFPVLTWSVALAVLTMPLYQRLAPSRHPSISAGVGTFAVAVFVIGPAVLLGLYLISQARTALDMLKGEQTIQQWRHFLEQHHTLAHWVQWLQDKLDLQGQLETFTDSLGQKLPALLGGSAWIVIELLMTLFVLFYFFRDRHLILRWLREHSPFSDRETTLVFDRVRDCMFATVGANIFTSVIQGSLGGLMMGILGLPLPVLWGAIMALFSMIPTLGAPVIWIPAALILFAQGSWVKAIILALWGSFVIGLVDNVLYPILVGRRVTVHTVPIFFSYLGGIVLFGFSGFVLGPLSVTVTWTLLEIWRQRTARGREATDAIRADVS
jgi:predicted PurR-regulated permease PerM